MKSAYAFLTVLLLTPLFFASAQQAPQNPSTTAAASQKPALTVQHEANFDAERQQANQFYLAGRQLEALPLYEDLCRQDQANPVFAERHGAGLLAKAQTTSDPKQQQALIMESIKELQRAESLGDNSPYVVTMLGTLSKTPIGLLVGGPMGGLPLTVGYYYHGSTQAQTLIQQGEAAFNHNDLTTALKSYTAAAAADPSLYTAALFMGDVYFRLKDNTNAGVWYAKAIAIDPDRETAYRYWGDALMHAGDSDGARVKYEQAMAAEPYTRSTFAGLQQWAAQTHTALMAPQVRRPDFSITNGNITFTGASLTTEAGDGHNSWLVYAQTRLAHDPHVIFNEWAMAGSTPNTLQFNFVPSGYVHTLAEEVEAITAMLADVEKKLAAGSVTQGRLEPGLRTLLQLQKDQMLEPFILLSFNDAGLRHGYPEYRAAHRDQIAAYIDRYMISHSTTPVTQQPNGAPVRPAQNNPVPMNAGAARREAALVPAYEAQKAHNYETAYEFFTQAIPDFPGDLRVIMLAAGAARDAGHLEESLALYQQILQNDRYYANRQLPNVIQLYAALGRWQEFDEARKIARTAALGGDNTLSAVSGYVIEDYNDGTRHIQVLEFPTAYGRFHTRYRFRIISETDPTTHFTPYIDLESDDIDQISFRQQHPDKAAAGERAYSLDGYPKLNTQGLIRFYDGEPTYEEVRAVVFSRQPQTPAATTIINHTAPNISTPQATPSPQSQTPPSGLRLIGGGVSMPVVIHSAEPQFTEAARKAKFSGTVQVTFIVDVKGIPQNVRVTRSVGLGLNENVVNAVKEYRYKPAMENGNPVPVALTIAVNFQIYKRPS